MEATEKKFGWETLKSSARVHIKHPRGGAHRDVTVEIAEDRGDHLYAYLWGDDGIPEAFVELSNRAGGEGFTMTLIDAPLPFSIDARYSNCLLDGQAADRRLEVLTVSPCLSLRRRR